MSMNTIQPPAARTGSAAENWAKLRRQYGCGPVEFTGTVDALYERHLVFDDMVPLTAVGARGSRRSPARCVTCSRSAGC